MAPNATKPRSSKHKKKAWKHIDLYEINQYYQDKELDERTGQDGKSTFFISKHGDETNVNELNNIATSESVVPFNIKENISNPTKRIIESLNVYKHLKSASAVPAFKKNEPINPKQPVLNHIRLRNKEERLLANAIKIKEQRQKDAKEKKKKLSRAFDVWAEKPKTPIGEHYVDYAEDLEHLHLATLYKCLPKPTEHTLQKPSLLPACEEPHPGISYNPTDEDHTQLLVDIATKKKQEIKEQKKLKRKLEQNVKTNLNLEEEYTREMMQGLLEDDDEDQKGEQEEDEEEGQSKTIVTVGDLKRRKTKKQARHEATIRKLSLAAEKRRKAKKFDSEFFKIRQYLRDHANKMKKLKERKKFRKEMEVKKMYQPARLGKQKYVEAEPEFNLKSEIHGSLRKLNTDGNLLMDRFKSFQRRNLIEHRLVLKLLRSKAKRKNIINQAIYNKDFAERKSSEGV